MVARSFTSAAPRGKPLDPSAVLSTVSRGALYAMRWLEAAADRRGQRLALRELDDHLLKDIGVSRAEAWRATRKPFWRA